MAFAGRGDDEMSASKCRGRSRIQGFQGLRQRQHVFGCCRSLSYWQRTGRIAVWPGRRTRQVVRESRCDCSDHLRLFSTTSHSVYRAGASVPCWRCWLCPRDGWSPPLRWSGSYGRRPICRTIRSTRCRSACRNSGALWRLWVAEACVTRDGAGYRLDVNEAAVDAHAFQSLIQAARRTGDPDRAVGGYDRALALWRGEPLEDFAGEPWTLVEVARLTELRLAAVAERAERMLTLGRYAELVADLEPIVTAEPIRERLVGQLMTALFNAGRQVEALEVYAHTRQRLADELGLDPSRELRSVMEQILRQDSAVGPLSSTRSVEPLPAGVSPTGNLPLRWTSFVGRGGELRRVLQRLVDARLITLVGPGGAGKTSLAVEAARSASPRFPDGSWLVRLAPIRDAGHAGTHCRRRARAEHRGRHGNAPSYRCADRSSGAARDVARDGQLRAPARAGWRR